MIHFLDGALITKKPTHVVVDVQGVGYEVFITLSTYESLPESGQKVRLLTYFSVREDAQQLFGFAQEQERELFRLLIGVSGIGPKSAIHILSGIRVEDLKQAVLEEDTGRLATAPGVGKKTAERIVVELKGKIQEMTGHDAIKGRMAGTSAEAILWNDALSALISLGYNQATAQKAIRKTLMDNKEVKTVEEVVRRSLQHV